MGERTLCLWCPDWPVVALRRAERVPPAAPVVVVGGAGTNGRVQAASAEARAEGVRRGMRKREAEARCPVAVVVDSDPGLEARTFEQVARALDAVSARLAIDRPGLLSFPIRGPLRYFKTEAAVTEAVLAASGPHTDARVGVAASPFAALLAARKTSPAAPVRVLDDPSSEETTTEEFLATRSVGVLADRGFADLAGLLRRLGIRTLGDLAELPEASVVARFGVEGILAHRLARGVDQPVAALAAPPLELAETAELDPPAQRVDVAAFAARALAEQLLERLAQRGLAVTRVMVEAETEHGESLARVWRFRGPFTHAALAQRVRWQLEAWVGGGERADEHGTTTGGLTLLRLVPEEVVPARGHQLEFWASGGSAGGMGDARAGEQAARVLARLQGMLGHEAVMQPVLSGGRTPVERTMLVPFGDALPDALLGDAALPWPGMVPPPAPALVYDPPLPAALTDAVGRPVRVSGRGELSAKPTRFRCEHPGIDGEVEQWSGPWIHDVRSWDPATRHRRALFQVVANGTACLVALEHGRAGVLAVYD